MMTDLMLVPLSASTVGPWLRGSLEQGHGLSKAVLRRQSLDEGNYFALIPSTLKTTPVFEEGGVTSPFEADVVLSAFLDSVA